MSPSNFRSYFPSLAFSLFLAATTAYAAPSSHNWGYEFTDTNKALQLTKGQPNIVVAIIDTGADLQHPALQEHLWTNPGESGTDLQGHSKSDNQIDDDTNGFVDDVHGWNFADNSNRVFDQHGHGTHVAGIIAGAAPKASLMILKYYNPQARGDINQANTVRAIEYAIQMKARIINYSAGGNERSAGEEASIQKAGDQDILFVAAAGNEHANSDTDGFFPASYNLENIVSVTAVDPLRSILPSSNFGRNTVDLAAPGKAISSSAPFGQNALMTGTSQATAFVSGTAALVMAENPELRAPAAIIPYLTQTGSESANLYEKTKSGRALNSYQSLVMKGADLSAFGHKVVNTEFETLEDELPFRQASTAGSAARLALPLQ